MNASPNPNQVPPPSGSPENRNAPSGFKAPQALPVINLSALLGDAASAGAAQLGPNPAIDPANPFAGFSQLPGTQKEKGSPLSANLGASHLSREALENTGATVAGSQPPIVPPNLAAFAAAAGEPLDPEDLTSFALPDDYNFSVAKKVLTSVQVKKPSKESFVRTNPDPATWKPYSLLELKEEGKIYLVSPSLAAALEAEGESTLTKALLVPTVDRRGNFFLWILKLSDRESSWHLSGNRAAELAKSKWVRIQSNMSAGAYDTSVAENQDAQPVWPEEDLATILKIAFEGKVITSRDHPVLKELRGGN